MLEHTNALILCTHNFCTTLIHSKNNDRVISFTKCRPLSLSHAHPSNLYAHEWKTYKHNHSLSHSHPSPTLNPAPCTYIQAGPSTFSISSPIDYIPTSVTRLGDLLDFGLLFKATINLPKSPTFLVNNCKGVKIFNFSSEIIFGHLFWHMAIFIWSHW